jgi:signal transduction histidine kinase
VYYNRRVNLKLHESEEALDTKRKFVRFISHEIRTPLNTVCLGLKILCDEIGAMRIKMKDFERNISKETEVGSGLIRNFSKLEQSDCSLLNLDNWSDLIRDLIESSNSAVQVLNEIMSYDKIEMKTFHIEKEVLPVWKLISESIRPFNIQAREKGIEINLDLEVQQNPAIEDLAIIGDPLKLEQVFRNIISNALKFSPPNSVVKVVARYLNNITTIAEGIYIYTIFYF